MIRIAFLLCAACSALLAPVDVPSDPLRPILRAVARTEGFYAPGTLPHRFHNPGALTVARGARYGRYATDLDGWLDLRAWFAGHCGPLRRVLTVYNPRSGYADYVIRLGKLDPKMEVCGDIRPSD